MIIDHETIETYFDLLRNADDNGRITVVMKDCELCTGYSLAQLKIMSPDERCQVLYDATFIGFVVSLHKLSPFAGGDGFRALGAELQMDGGVARLEFNLARAFGLPGLEPAAELVELCQFLEHWVALYKRHGTLRGGTVRIWSAGSPCSIDWNEGASTLSQATVEAISKNLVIRVEASKTLTEWLAHVRQGLCLIDQYSTYNCSPEDILTEEEYFSLPGSTPAAAEFQKNGDDGNTGKVQVIDHE